MDSDYLDFEHPEPVPCCRILNPNDSRGELKTQYSSKDNGGLIYDREDDGGFSISFERILQVDGWSCGAEAVTENTPREAMTLMVSKLTVTCTRPKRCVRSVKSRLKFERLERSDKPGPEVVAWAPFRELEKTNQTNVNEKQTTTTDIHAGFKGDGAEVGTSRTKVKEISFERKYFARAFAAATMNKAGKRGGVQWCMQQNEKQKDGVVPTIYTAVLLSRATLEEPYIVESKIQINGGTLYDLKNDTLDFFGIGPGVTKPYLVQPDFEQPRIRYEGASIFPTVDRENLFGLVTRTEQGPFGLVIHWDTDDPADDKNETAIKLGETR